MPDIHCAILDSPCSKLEELSSRDDNNLRMGIFREDVVSPSLQGSERTLTKAWGEEVRLVLPRGQRTEEETSGVLPALRPTCLCTQRM